MKNYNHFNSVLTPQHLAIIVFRRQSKPGFLQLWKKELIKTPLTAFYVVQYNQQEHLGVCVVLFCFAFLNIYLFDSLSVCMSVFVCHHIFLLSFIFCVPCSLLNSLRPYLFLGRRPLQMDHFFLLALMLKPLSIIRKLIIKMLNLTISFVLKYVEAIGRRRI